MFETNVADDYVCGVIFDVPEDEMGPLRKEEGVGQGYSEQRVEVELADGTTETVIAFIADGKIVDPALRPYTWYHALVVTGAEEHGLPEDYIAKLRATSAIEDPVSSRGTKRKAEEALRLHHERRQRLT